MRPDYSNMYAHDTFCFPSPNNQEYCEANSHNPNEVYVTGLSHHHCETKGCVRKIKYGEMHGTWQGIILRSPLRDMVGVKIWGELKKTWGGRKSFFFQMFCILSQNFCVSSQNLCRKDIRCTSQNELSLDKLFLFTLQLAVFHSMFTIERFIDLF